MSTRLVQPAEQPPRRFRLGEVRLLERAPDLWMARIELSVAPVASEPAPILRLGRLAIGGVMPTGFVAIGQPLLAIGPAPAQQLNFAEPVKLSVPARETPGFRGEARVTNSSPIYFARERTAEAVGSILELPRKSGQLGYRLPLDDRINLQPELVFTLRPGQSTFNASRVVGGSVRLVFTF
ncbi:MAG: hypothetical protein SFY95_09540 [Planctomycetota bacterium]|nr:hypothetical protein [Planctomycetota bacterium]